MFPCFRPQENGGRQFELSSLASLEKELLSPEVVRNTRNQQDVNEEREMIKGRVSYNDVYYRLVLVVQSISALMGLLCTS